MKIKGFADFGREIYESSFDRDLSDIQGKTAFSRWLRGVSQRMKNEVQDIKSEGGGRYTSSGLGTADIHAQSRAAREIIPGILGIITAGGAAIADFFGGSKSAQPVDKKNIKKLKPEILDDWEKREIGNKKVKPEDAENFYKSGVLQGKKYFGSGYEPMTPKNKNEESFTDYLNSATKRYYDKSRTTR